MKITVMGVLIVISTMVLLALIADHVVQQLDGNRDKGNEQANNPA